MPAADIADVLSQLDRVIDRSRTDGERTGYFAALYRHVTARVRDGIAAGRFEDGPRMERLDVIFASRYLDALETWRSGGAPTRSWAVAFESGLERSPIVLQHLLLGMNAHINLDLGIAAAETAPGSELASLRRDFDEISTLLAEMLDDVQERIGRVSPWMWILDRVGARKDEVIANFAIGKARRVAWRSAQGLASASESERSARIAATDRLAAVVGRAIRRPAWTLRPAYWAVRSREPDDPAVVIDALAR